jgi:hypothetical protein
MQQYCVHVYAASDTLGSRTMAAAAVMTVVTVVI